MWHLFLRDNALLRYMHGYRKIRKLEMSKIHASFIDFNPTEIRSNFEWLKGVCIHIV